MHAGRDQNSANYEATRTADDVFAFPPMSPCLPAHANNRHLVKLEPFPATFLPIYDLVVSSMKLEVKGDDLPIPLTSR